MNELFVLGVSCGVLGIFIVTVQLAEWIYGKYLDWKCEQEFIKTLPHFRYFGIKTKNIFK